MPLGGAANSGSVKIRERRSGSSTADGARRCGQPPDQRPDVLQRANGSRAVVDRVSRSAPCCRPGVALSPRWRPQGMVRSSFQLRLNSYGRTACVCDHHTREMLHRLHSGRAPYRGPDRGRTCSTSGSATGSVCSHTIDDQLKIRDRMFLSTGRTKWTCSMVQGVTETTSIPPARRALTFAGLRAW